MDKQEVRVPEETIDSVFRSMSENFMAVTTLGADGQDVLASMAHWIGVFSMLNFGKDVAEDLAAGVIRGMRDQQSREVIERLSGIEPPVKLWIEQVLKAYCKAPRPMSDLADMARIGLMRGDSMEKVLGVIVMAAAKEAGGLDRNVHEEN